MFDIFETLHSRNQTFDISVEVNCDNLTNHRVYHGLIHRNEVLKTILTGSATPPFFRATFLDPIFSLSWSSEQATTCFKIAIASAALVNSEPCESQIKGVHRGR